MDKLAPVITSTMKWACPKIEWLLVPDKNDK
jgi:hypothetical protein